MRSNAKIEQATKLPVVHIIFPFLSRPSKNLLTSQDGFSTKATEHSSGIISPALIQPMGQPGNALLSPISLTTVLTPVLAPVPGPLHMTEGKDLSKARADECRESSESDREGLIGKQLLSYVQDDPDFESDDSEKRPKLVSFWISFCPRVFDFGVIRGRELCNGIK